jgi:hypothetical protein
MTQDRNDPTGRRKPAIDKMLGEVFAEETGVGDASGQTDRDEAPTKLTLDVITTDKLVILELSQAVRWINMPPELAIDLGNVLKKWGRKLIKKQHEK